MTFAELQEKIGARNEADWKQHKNGGGWIYKSATVDDTVYVGSNAIIFSGRVHGNARVYGNAWVYGDARVYGNAWVYGDARVYGNARVYGDAQVHGDAQVYGDARVYGNAWVCGDARVYGDAQVHGNAWDKSPLFILGSKHSLTNAKRGHIQIGCHCKLIKWWAENYKDIGKKEGYTEAEIEEYGYYIELFQKVGK